MADVTNLCEQLDALRENIPKEESSRKRLMDSARELSLALETTGDNVQRLIYIPLQLTLPRIANQLDLFEMVIDHPNIHTQDIATQKNADPVLLGRLLRYLSAQGMLKEVEADKYGPEQTSPKALYSLELKLELITSTFATIMPCFQALPQYLADTHYQNPADMMNAPFQRAHSTSDSLFEWMGKHPFNFHAFTQWMTVQGEGQPIWLDVFPFEELLKVCADRPLLIDVGGGVGHQCAALKSRFPDVSGRVVLQDLPATLPHAIPTPGVEVMAYDFFTPQPIKGARAYYMRNIMHDYPDAKCIQILQNTKAAMTAESVILIDEMVLSNQGVHWLGASLDILMMCVLAAIERTEKQWHDLLDAAGLKIRDIYTYTEDLRDSIIVAVPK